MTKAPQTDKRQADAPQMPRKSGRGKTASRRAAAAMLAAIERGKTLDEARDRLQDLPANDRAFADLMVLTALRHYGEIEATLAPCLARPLPARPHLARALLYIGAVQLLYLDTPAHAAINETVAATGRREQPFRGLINAVLRRLDREAEALRVTDPLRAWPDWLAASWQAHYGAPTTQTIASTMQTHAPTDLCFISEDDADAFMAALPDTLKASRLAARNLRLSGSLSVPELPFYETGTWWVQDIAATLAAQILAVPTRADALDLCAAPGGKTLQMAAGGAQVTALDMSAPRLERLRANLARTGLSAHTICAALEDWSPQDRQWPYVLLDAPCSATGTIRRHPDLPLHRKASHIAGAARVQQKLLTKAAALTAPGGQLVYCVCSLQPEEGEAIAADFLADAPHFSTVPVKAETLPTGLQAALTGEGWLRTHPAMLAETGGCDGFFIARFARAG
jgi:16S rRNA (cytosine967-C5)-methyltransferase